MLRFVEVAVGHVRVVLQARHGKQIVAVRRFPHVNEVDEPLAVIPQVARPDLNPSRRPVVRMTGDAERRLPPDRAQDVLGRLIGRDEFRDVQRNDVRIPLAADVVLRDLGAREPDTGAVTRT